MPRKAASENVVCLCRLLNILANFSNLLLHTGKQYGPHLEDFPHLYKGEGGGGGGDNFCDFLFSFPAHQVPSKKVSTMKGKNLLPIGVDPFSERWLNQF